MDPQKIAAQLTSAITSAIANPLSMVVWLIGTIAILGMASIVLAPLLPSILRPHGQVQTWVWIAGFCYLIKGAGR